MSENIEWYIANLGNEFSLAVVLLAGLGAYVLCRRHLHLAMLLLTALLVQWAYTFNYEIHDIYVFHISGYVLLSLLVASGAGWLADEWSTLSWRSWGRPFAAAALVLVVSAVSIWPIAGPQLDAVRDGRVPSFPFGPYPVQEDLEYSHLLLGLVVRKIEQDAIVFAKWQFLYPYYYVAHIEQGRTDLVFLEEKPYRAGEQQESSMLAYVEARIGERPVYFEHCLEELTDAGYRCRLVPTGNIRLYHVLPAQ